LTCRILHMADMDTYVHFAESLLFWIVDTKLDRFLKCHFFVR
jgi:hypothetical protein